MSDENKAIVRRFIDELQNKRNLAIVDELLSTDEYSGHDSLHSAATNNEEVKAGLDKWFTAFPDFKVTIEDQLAEGDKVTTRGVMTGTHDGVWQGVPPTGKPMRSTFIFIHRLKDRKIVERWVNADHLGILRQIGVSLPQ